MIFPVSLTHGLVAAAMVLASAAPLPAQSPATSSPPIPIAGAWIMTLEMPVGVSTPELVLTTKGNELSGTYSGRYGEFPVAGLVSGRVVTFSFEMGPETAPVMICFTGEWVDETATLKGTATIGELGAATWTAERDPHPDKR